MITREQIRELLTGTCNEPITQQDADQMRADYPYFSVPQLLYMKYTPGAMPDDARIQQALIYASPDEHLESTLDIEGESFADLYPQAPQTDTTLQAIDLFLGTYQKGNRTGKRSEEEELERLIGGSAIAQSNYIATLQQEEEKETNPIPTIEKKITIPLPVYTPENGIIEKTAPAIAPKAKKAGNNRVNILGKGEPTTPESGTEDTFFTESLAKIYIKQRRYEKALEIIKKLSLKYPEKNIYFADQIRFLEKLIINIKTE